MYNASLVFVNMFRYIKYIKSMKKIILFLVYLFSSTMLFSQHLIEHILYKGDKSINVFENIIINNRVPTGDVLKQSDKLNNNSLHYDYNYNERLISWFDKLNSTKYSDETFKTLGYELVKPEQRNKYEYKSYKNCKKSIEITITKLINNNNSFAFTMHWHASNHMWLSSYLKNCEQVKDEIIKNTFDVSKTEGTSEDLSDKSIKEFEAKITKGIIPNNIIKSTDYDINLDNNTVYYKFEEGFRVVVWNDNLIKSYKYSNEAFDRLGYEYVKNGGRR